MNAEMRQKLGLEDGQAYGRQLEELLTIGSKIFYQTHFYPLIKMQNSVREIYLVFKGAKNTTVPVLLNVEVKQIANTSEIVCGGMEISNRNRYEKELLEAKKIAENALNENAELIKAKNALVAHQKKLESQIRKVNLLKQQQQEVFKLIAHDLQEPLRKTMFSSNYILSKFEELPQIVVEQLNKIVGFSGKMSDMLLTLLQFRELDSIKLEHTQIDLTNVINDALIISQLQNDQECVMTFPDKHLKLHADKRLITRLFLELLKNSQRDRNKDVKTLNIEITAIETVRNSFLQLSDTYSYSTYIKIIYLDNGTGFRSKFSEIIQNGVQFDSINIGLAYCKKIVEKHSGIITANSIKGKGVRYTILLPQEQAS